jgi:hypothetical protein
MPGTAPPHAPADRGLEEVRGPSLSDLVAGWVAEGIITTEQADRIMVRVGTATPSRAEAHPGLRPVFVEALGYLGGVVVAVGCGVLASLYWSALTYPGQVVLLAVAAALLVGAGFAVPRRPGGLFVRLRAVLWVAATVSWTATLGLYVWHLLPSRADDHAGVLVTGGAAILAVTLWSVHRVLLQQAVMMALLAALAATVIADFGSGTNWPGVGVWLTGVAWLALGWTALLRPPRVASALGAATAIVGSMITAGSDVGVVLMLVTTLGVVVLAVLLHDLTLLVIGALGLLQGVPAAVGRWFPNSLVAALALVVVGVGLVGVAVWTARRSASRSQHDH